MNSTVNDRNGVLLSVIIPVYNTEKYLKRCLDSVIAAIEKIDSSEIIVINDGSPGNTDKIIESYLKKYNKILKYYKKENSGLAQTKNFGLEKALGNYVTFVDSDDYIDENYYFDVFNVIQKENSDIVICDFETVKGNIEKFRTHAKNQKIEDDKWGCIDISIMPSSCNKVVKRELYGDLKYPSGLLYEDLATTLVLLLKAEKIVYLPKMYYKYTIRENSIMREKFNEKKFKIIDILEILFSRLKSLNIANDDIDRSINYVSYERIYFELLDPLSKEKFLNKYILARKLCKKVEHVIRELNKNIYYKQQLKEGRKIRIIYSYLVNFALYYKLPMLLCMVINKAVYFNNQHFQNKWS